ncbi:serine protease [Iodidimonas muriae]|uniref:Serine protease n=1 Tax=Iodidimonas muriae TaxID=261467 RepID=A0ABQ2LI34_9PROT|nr:Do family serine endopeptidase [Iodidimonas muriae]GER08673.1 serine protease [Kordiimonadales bacterium JCM 17843]GGO17048.1 serine protease [Iodidimonas muriae]
MMRVRFCLSFLVLGVLGASIGVVAQEDGDTGREGTSLVRRVPTASNEVLLSYAPVVKEVAPAVVNIYTARKVAARQSVFSDSFFRRFMGDNFSFGAPRERVERSLGSGVIVRADGVVVTNNHVIGEADTIKVVLADRREYDAEVILADARTDLAILRIDAGEEDLPVARLADVDQMEVGDIVLAIGNPFGIGQTVTSGIVSATARTQVGVSDFGFFLQTDAAVNPGNSGGALVALTGDLVGINTAIFSRTGDTSGIGFAIPASMVRSVLRAALDEGEIIRPWLGIAGQPVTSDIARAVGLDRPGGVMISDLYEGGPAALSGLEPGDVILGIDGEDVVDERGLRFRTATREAGDHVQLLVLRDGERSVWDVELALLPEVPERQITRLDGRHPFQGITVGNLSPRFAEELGVDPMRTGVVTLEVSRRSPAGRFGFVRPGDIILNVQNEPVASVDDLLAITERPWENWVYRVRRSGRLLDCAVAKNGAVECRVSG